MIHERPSGRLASTPLRRQHPAAEACRTISDPSSRSAWRCEIIRDTKRAFPRRAEGARLGLPSTSGGRRPAARRNRRRGETGRTGPSRCRSRPNRRENVQRAESDSGPEGPRLHQHDSRPGRARGYIGRPSGWSVAGSSPLFEQARGVAGDRVQARVPAERPRPRAADHLVERERIGVGSHLRTRFLDRHVSHVGPVRQIRADRRDTMSFTRSSPSSLALNTPEASSLVRRYARTDPRDRDRRRAASDCCRRRPRARDRWWPS